MIKIWIAWVPSDDSKNGNEPPEYIGIPFAQSLLCGDDYPCDTWSKPGLVFALFKEWDDGRTTHKKIIFCYSLGALLCFNLGKKGVYKMKSERLNIHK